jgi:hypothetical protein
MADASGELRAKVVHDGLRPTCSDGTKFEGDAAALVESAIRVATLGYYSIEVARPVEYHRSIGKRPVGAVPFTLRAEVVEDGFVPAAAAVRRELKYGS